MKIDFLCIFSYNSKLGGQMPVYSCEYVEQSLFLY